MRFPQSFIDEVRHAADIVAVVQDYVSLRKAGAGEESHPQFAPLGDNADTRPLRYGAGFRRSGP